MSNEQLDAKAHELLVTWNKANNYINTFALKFYELRREFEQYDTYMSFGAWLVSKTQLDEVDIIKKLGLFGDALASETREENAAAKEELKREAKATEDRVAREKKTREDIRAQQANENRKQQDKQQYRATNSNKPTDPMDAIYNLVAQIKSAMNVRKMGREQWMRGTRDLALLLVKAKETFPNNTKFGEWLDKYDIKLNKTERAALIQLGYQPNLETILQQADSFSVELIWRKVQKESTIESMP